MMTARSGGIASAMWTHYGFALADARSNPALDPANGAFCGRPPRADRTKCGVSPHLPQMPRRGRPPGPRVVPPASYWENRGARRNPLSQ